MTGGGNLVLVGVLRVTGMEPAQGGLMPLSSEEIVRGNVAILNGDLLLIDPLVQSGDHGRIGKRPFLCLKSEGGNSRWMLLTTQISPKRLSLDKWKLPGSAKWMSDNQYLHDARKIFIGPNESFMAAALEELPHRPHRRPSLSEDGVVAVELEVEKYLG
ncbi:hypothetical protein ACDZ94_20295 [Pseudomonas sp. UBT]|uniref:hypothetical protein n=1 Tax=Pseudomonas sp. UBT TaxID=3239198 RepID=UPI003D8031DF